MLSQKNKIVPKNILSQTYVFLHTLFLSQARIKSLHYVDEHVKFNGLFKAIFSRNKHIITYNLFTKKPCLHILKHLLRLRT